MPLLRSLRSRLNVDDPARFGKLTPMPLYEMTPDALTVVSTTTFASADVRERQDLQRLLRDHVEVVYPDTLVVAEEWGEFEDSRRRIDLLGVHSSGDLVVIELKRTEDGGHMELQAIRYAAMVSAMTFARATDIYADHLRKLGRDPADAAAALADHLGGEDEPERLLARRVRIVLVSADFGKELTTAVLWLNDNGLDVTCVQLRPHTLDGRTLLDVRQVIPLPEAAAYQTKLKEKAAEERVEAAGRSTREMTFVDFWQGLLQRAKMRGIVHLHAGRYAGPYPQFPVGSHVRGCNWTYSIRQSDTDAMFRVSSSVEHPERVMDPLQAKRDQIEAAVGSELEWEEAAGRLNAAVRLRLLDGGYANPHNEWPRIQDAMIDAMIRLEAALRPHLDALDL